MTALYEKALQLCSDMKMLALDKNITPTDAFKNALTGTTTAQINDARTVDLKIHTKEGNQIHDKQ